MLDTLTFVRLTEVPLPAGFPDQSGSPERPGVPAPVRPHALLPALASAHATGTPSAVAWLRPRRGAQLEVLVGGGLVTGDGSVPYPPGARGVALRRGRAVAAMRRLPVWLRCGAEQDPLAAGTAENLHQTYGGVALEDIATHLGPGAFGWLVVAEPVPAAEARALAEDLHYTYATLPDRAEASVREALALERVTSRHRDLARAAAIGAWRVHVFTGGPDENRARRAAGLWCASADLHPLPYLLAPAGGTGTLDGVVATPVPGTAPTGGSPFVAASDLLAAIARPPIREVPGVRLVEPSTFDLTPEVSGEVPLGQVLDEAGNPAGELAVALASLNRHALVAGATGAGKSQTVRHLLEGLHSAGVPWLVVEPAKAEYAGMAGRLEHPGAGRRASGGRVVVIRPGDPDAAPVSLNPLQPEPGFPLQTHVDLVRALFLAAFQANEPFPQVLAKALVRCYQRLGWDLATGEPQTATGVVPAYPRLADLQAAAGQVVAEVGYGAELTADVRGFVDVRLGSLRLGGAGRFFEGGHPLDLGDLLARNAVLELEHVGNDQDKAFVIGAVLVRLVEHLRVRVGRAGGGHTGSGPVLRHVTVVEEAHRLLRATAADTPAGHAVELFAALLAEIRAYGEGIVVAEQIPTKLLPDVVKNTALKVVHRLPAADDRQVVGATMNLSGAQSRYVVSLPPGRAAVFADGMDRPVLVQVPYGEQREARDPAPAAPVMPGRRSAACGASCRQQPCTFRQIARADRLADDPRLTLWIELLALAHIIGEPRPVPLPGTLDDLLTDDAREVECALATLAQRAVDLRYPQLAARYQPERLAAHLATLAADILRHGAPPCPPDREAAWQAGRYRYAGPVHALTNWTGPRDQPHPDTPRWRAGGLRLPGATIDAQLAAVRRHPEVRADPAALLFGNHQSGPLRTALDTLATAEPPAERLRQAASFLHIESDWPARWLYPPSR